MRAVYRWWAIILFLAIVLQVGFAGYGAFYAAGKLDGEGATIDEDTFMDGFGLHAAFGYLVLLAGLIFMVIGLVAGVGKWRLGRHGLLFLLLFVQLWLAWIGFESAIVGFFHPINALLITGLSGWIARDEWRLSRSGPAPAAAT